MRAPHPFPARMAPDLALASVSRGKSGIVLDPMCGSGMVLKSALAADKPAMGFDVDPLAVLMSSVWTGPAVDSLESAAAAAVRQAESLQWPVRLPWMDGDKETSDFVDFWFAKAQQADLRRLASVLQERGQSDPEANALRLALSRTIVTKSRGASLASDVSHSRPHRTRTTNDFDVFAGFVQAARAIGKALSESPNLRTAQVSLGDARSLRDVTTGSVGMIVTSPPYLNAIDYLRGHRLALVWLGHTIGSLRAIRGGSIGSERQWRESISDTRIADMTDELAFSDFPAQLRGVMTRYLVDLDAVMRESFRVLAPEGECVLVVGNCTIRGLFVDNAEIVRVAASASGFELAERSERELPENKRYLPPPKAALADQMSKRMRTEVVLRVKKPALV